MAKFEQPEMKVVNIGDTVPLGKVYCNGRVWNAKRKKWQFSIKAY